MKCRYCKQYVSYEHYYVGASLICEVHLTMLNNKLQPEEKICKKCYFKKVQEHKNDYDLPLNLL